MSWLSRVSDIAGRAEDLLNKIDQNAAEALSKPKNIASNYGSSIAIDIDTNSIKSAPIISYDESTNNCKSKSRTDHLVSSSLKSHRIKAANDESLITYLNDRKCETNSSRRSSVTSQFSLSNPTGDVRHSSATAFSSSANDDFKARNDDLLKCLHLKESQLAVMSVRLQEVEEELMRKDEKLTEFMRKNEEVYKNESIGSAKETKRIVRERVDFEKREKDYCKRIESANIDRSMLLKEIRDLKSAISEMEITLKRTKEELRLAKYNLEANKNEFDEYKQRAQKILNSKEKLLESLKHTASVGEPTNPVELEELRSERELLKEDLQQSQLTIYNLKADIQDLENRLREEQKSAGLQRENLLEQFHRSSSSANQYREQLERMQLEYEFLQAEMRRQEEAVERKLAEKDSDLMKLMEEKKVTRKYDSKEIEERIAVMSERLIAKQTDIERLESERRALELRLERSERACLQAEAAAIKAYSTEYSSDSNRQRNMRFFDVRSHNSLSTYACKFILTSIDSFGLRLTMSMRSPVFRYCFFIYCIILHAWVLFILLTYSPEIHPL